MISWLKMLRATRRNLFALLIAAPWLLVAAVRIFALDFSWPLTALVAFTPQTLLTLVIPVVCTLLLRARWAMLVLVVTAAALVLTIVPRTVSDTQPRATGKSVQLLTANLRKGHADMRALAEMIRSSGAEIVTLQEAEPRNIAELRASGLRRSLPHVVAQSSDGRWANWTLSRWPLKASSNRSYLSGRWPAIEIPALGLELNNFHSYSPTTPARTSEWHAGLASLPSADGELRVISGDFNATLDHRSLRSVLGRGYRDAGDETGNGLRWTWVIGTLTRLVLDHVLVPAGVSVHGYNVRPLPGSDHRAVSVRLQLPG